MHIYVMDNGFVLVGTTKERKERFDILEHCSVVRRWGTDKGLGQLAREGPTGETILDYEGVDVEVYHAYIMRRIPCDERRWTVAMLQQGVT